MERLKGQLLISGGGLYDPNFRHTVVLIADHNESGAFGIVLNRRLELTVEEAAPPLADLVARGETLFRGGPVEPNQVVLVADAADPDVLDILVFDSVGLITREMTVAVRSQIHRVRVFAGYSGWGPGQLEAEMAANAWIVDPARGQDVFTADPDGLWRTVLERKGPPYTTLARVPFDPSVN